VAPCNPKNVLVLEYYKLLCVGPQLTGWEHKFTFFTPEHHDRDRSFGAGHLQVMQSSVQGMYCVCVCRVV